MVKTVGIPRGLFFYKYYPLWKTFFEELGAKVVVSDRTTKHILDIGVKSCIDEACLPVKLFHGHVLSLKAKVDFLFIPRFTSISRNEYVCPKFGALPDVVRSALEDLPTIIDTEVNLRKSKRNALKAAYDTGGYFCSDRSLIRKAFKRAVKSYRDYRREVKKGLLPCDILEKKPVPLKQLQGEALNIAVIGHDYNLYDSYVNMNLINKLRANSVSIITVDTVDEDLTNRTLQSLPKRLFWNFGRRALGTALHILERKDVDGIIYLMSFGCGVDSFICDLIERKVRRSSSMPFIVLTLDEHSGEAGLNTRIEAFIDMIRWRNANEIHLPAFG